MKLGSPQVTDIKTARIDSCLEEIGDSVFCELPDDSPWTVDEFMQRMQVIVWYQPRMIAGNTQHVDGQAMDSLPKIAPVPRLPTFVPPFVDVEKRQSVPLISVHRVICVSDFGLHIGLCFRITLRNQRPVQRS